MEKFNYSRFFHSMHFSKFLYICAILHYLRFLLQLFLLMYFLLNFINEMTFCLNHLKIVYNPINYITTFLMNFKKNNNCNYLIKIH